MGTPFLAGQCVCLTPVIIRLPWGESLGDVWGNHVGAVEFFSAAMRGDRVLGSVEAEFLLYNFDAPTVTLFLLTGCARTHAFLAAFMCENLPYRGGSWLSWYCLYLIG